ncbi:hypothetical protein [Oscillatoria acuminata]|uniref:hypothetical protein n=1 Tax=Oscillatoria acuminata TaxID=118323 RepID=UPI0002EB482A|nr:hypothetical protein [Oscillatoria acuminata]
MVFALGISPHQKQRDRHDANGGEDLDQRNLSPFPGGDPGEIPWAIAPHFC